MGGRRRGAAGNDYSYVSPVVKYLLFMFNFLFWVSVLMLIDTIIDTDQKVGTFLFIVCVQIYSVSYTNLLVNKIIRLKTISGFELFQLCQALCFLLRLCVYPEHVRP